MKRKIIDPNGLFAEGLVRHFGYDSIHDLVRGMVGKILRSSRQHTPPIDLTAILSNRRISRLDVRQIPVDGRLLVRESGFIIQLKPSADTRRRFSLAHEIAHTLLYDIGSTVPNKLFHDVKPDEEEVFCNMVAAELLMPTNLVLERFRKASQNQTNQIKLIRIMASTFRVSIETMSRRIIEELNLLKGIILACRWLPKPADSEKPEQLFDWRLTWWTATRDLFETLYIPPSTKGPRIRIDNIEEAFNSKSGGQYSIDWTAINFGNLKQVLHEVSENEEINVWIYPIIAEQVQLFDERDIRFPQSYDDRLRKACDMVLFFPVP